MRAINRCVAIVKAKQPFLEWAKRLPEPRRQKRKTRPVASAPSFPDALRARPRASECWPALPGWAVSGAADPALPASPSARMRRSGAVAQYIGGSIGESWGKVAPVD